MISIEINKKTFEQLLTFLVLSLDGEGFSFLKPNLISIIKTKGWSAIIKVKRLQPIQVLSFVEALARCATRVEVSWCTEQTHDAQLRRSRLFQC
ncbi:MAG: hypothetical protein RBR45_14865 [Pseudomonas sp.]|nr:hypothetical protein [Pseudomonas sp.]